MRASAENLTAAKSCCPRAATRRAGGLRGAQEQNGDHQAWRRDDRNCSSGLGMNVDSSATGLGQTGQRARRNQRGQWRLVDVHSGRCARDA